MSFLDSLENNLKSLENREERDPEMVKRLREEQEVEKIRGRLIGPLAEQLKTCSFTSDLLGHATRIAHGLRTKVHVVWIGNTLRLQAKDQRLELVPTPDGIVAHFSAGAGETSKRLIDLGGNAEPLAVEFLKPLAVEN